MNKSLVSEHLLLFKYTRKINRIDKITLYYKRKSYIATHSTPHNTDGMVLEDHATSPRISSYLASDPG